MTDTPAHHEGAYELLSRPTLELSQAEVEAIIVELRKKREWVIANGKPDTTVKDAKAARTAKPKPADKAARDAATADLLAGLGDLLGGK